MNILESTIKELIKARVKTRADLALLKRNTAKKYKIACPSNIELLKAYHKLVKNRSIEPSKTTEDLLRTRPIRSLSGIVNISVLTSPRPQWGAGQALSCPGKCIFCPAQKGIPKSYLDNEPAVMRAILNKYDPLKQVQMRLQALKITGHPTDKIELRIIGGTWSYYPKQYQTWFITRCFAACNAELRRSPHQSDVTSDDAGQAPNQNKFGSGQAKRGTTRKIKSLNEAQKQNEKAKHRIIGLSVETRPDFITELEIKRMRKLGITGVELGVQSIYDDVLKLNNRGHGVRATIEATKLLKDSGFKICYQMMPNLPGSDLKRDKKMFDELFGNSDFQPDFLKIYPCVVLKDAKLYKLWKRKKYKPYSNAQLVKLLKNIKNKVPYYVRIIRVIRDIPSTSIEAGNKISNLRQIIKKELKKEGARCKCIRCREIKENYPPSHKATGDKVIQNLKLFRQDYDASGGKEIFLSYEDEKREKIYSLLRLRIPSQYYEKHSSKGLPSKGLPSKGLPSKGLPSKGLPVLQNAAIIREVHTYGQQVSLKNYGNYGNRISIISPQHKGLGKKLIKEAEKIVYTEFSRSVYTEFSRSVRAEFGIKKIAVISGIGVRGYFRKLGYRLKDEYMIKKI